VAAPRAHTPRRDRPTDGAAVAAIARAKGREPMPWQRDALDVALEYDPDTGHYAYEIVVVTVPRQSGKTTLEGDVADHRCLTVPRARAWITMQKGKTVDTWMREEHFADLRSAARVLGRAGSPSCRYRLSRRAGEVGVKWPGTGASFTTFPPTEDSLHSKQSDLVIVDEAWSFGAEQGALLRQAIRPTMATRPGSQLWIVSTAGTDASTYLADYVAMGRAALSNPSASVALVDYGIGPDDDAEDLDVVAAAHPAVGHTISRRSLELAREEFRNPDTGVDDVAGWARAYGNRGTRTTDAAIPLAVWTAAGRALRPAPAHPGIGFDVTPGGDHAAIVAAWRDAGEGYLDVLHTAATDRDLPGLLAQLARARRVPVTATRDSLGALPVLDALARHHPDVEQRLVSVPEYASACLTLEREIVRTGTLHHFHDDALDAAVTVATKIAFGDGGFRWGRKESAGNVAPLVAATVALHAFDSQPAPAPSPTTARVMSLR
jgi:hypothetical protein